MATPSVQNILQLILADIIDLSLLGKQAHWNVHGPHFRSIHLELDELVADARTWSDDVAERLVAIGGTAEGNPAFVSHASRLPNVDAGPIGADKVAALFADLTAQVSADIKEYLTALDEDMLSQDLVIGIARELEKHSWMFRSQVS